MSKFSKALATLLVLFAISGFVVVIEAQESGADAATTSDDNGLAATAATQLQEIRTSLDELREMREQREELEGEEDLLLQRRALRQAVETLGTVGEFVDKVVELEKQGAEASELHAAAEELLTHLAGVARERTDALQTALAELRGLRETTTGEELIKLEEQVTGANDVLNLLLEASLDNADRMEMLGLPGGAEKTYLTEILTDRAAVSSERVRLSLEQISALQTRLTEKPDDADLMAELAAIEAKRDIGKDNLTATIEMMSRLDLETTEYQHLLIQATGQITTDILDTKVAVSLIGQWLGGLRDWALDNGPTLIFNVFLFGLILFIFRLLSRLTRKLVTKAVSSSRLQFSQLMQKMFISISGNAVMVAGLLVALSQLGFSMGPILAGLGIVGFIIGFALQETLGNFAAGAMILIYRPYDVGDMIEAAGAFGKVSAMSLVSTTILTIDNQTLIIPNGKIWGDVIKNVTGQTMRRVDMVFGVSYTDDIPHTEKVLAAIVEEHPKVLDDPEPVIRLHTLGESSVDFVVRPWVKTDDYWDVYWDVTREVKMRFDKEGISIPFPQRDVHFYEESRLSGKAAPASAEQPAPEQSTDGS
jgi:small conductance mechanosensitive channel